MKRGGFAIIFALTVFILFLSLFFIFVSGQTTDDGGQGTGGGDIGDSGEETGSGLQEAGKEALAKLWKYDGQTLEQIINSADYSNKDKIVAIEKAVIDNDIQKEELKKLLELAVGKGIIDKEDADFYLEDKGLWGFIKLRGSYYYGALDGLIGRYVSAPLWDALSVDFRTERAFFGLAVLFWVVLFSPFSFWKTVKGERVSFYEIDKNLGTSYKSILFKYWWALILIYLGYLVLFAIPIVGRIMQVITLEAFFVLKDSVIWSFLIRSFVVGAVISFVPYFLNSYWAYRKRTEAYRKKMEEIAAVEAMKAQLKG